MDPRDERDRFWRVVGACLAAPITLALRVRVEGLEHVPSEGAAILAGNHVSSLDGVVLAVVVSRRARRVTRFLIAAEFFERRLFRRTLRRARQVPVRRGEGDAGALTDAEGALRGGGLVGIYPEGTINPDPTAGLLRGRSGAARLSLATGAPIVPVGIAGTEIRWPKSGLTPRRPWRPTVVLAFGAPVLPPVAAGGPPPSEDDRQEEIAALTARLMAAIAERAAHADRARRASRP